MPKRIVISGYYGFGNTGDEAVLAGILTSFRHLRLDVEITVLSGDPERTRAAHPGVLAVHRYRVPQLIRAIGAADLVISGGGSLLQDATSARSIFYYLFILRLARVLRRKTMIYAQGVGPLIRPSARRAVARALNRVDAITLRDDDSQALLGSIGVTRPTRVVADPAFLVEPEVRAADRLLESHGLGNGDFFTVSVRPWEGRGDWLREIGDGLRAALGRTGAGLAVLPMQEPEDLTVSSELGIGQVLRDIGGAGVVKGIIGRSSLVVGMRLHSLIFAASEEVPFVPVVYDPKVASFAAIARQQPVDLRTLSAPELCDHIAAAWERRAERAVRLAVVAAQMKRNALAPAQIAADLLFGT